MIHCLTRSYPEINETKKSNCLTARVCIHLCDRPRLKVHLMLIITIKMFPHIEKSNSVKFLECSHTW